MQSDALHHNKISSCKSIIRIFLEHSNHFLSHCFVAADYKQMEMRLLAVAANDERLIKFFKSGSDTNDFFKFMASTWFNKEISTISEAERNRTKHIVYAIAYGAGKQSLAKDLQMTEQDAGKQV